MKETWPILTLTINQNIEKVKNERVFYYGLDKTMCKLSANFAFDKATNGQTDIKHEMW